MLVGRREGSDLWLACTSVSGVHAELKEKGDQLWIQDLESTNGTFVNGIRIDDSRKLDSGDIVQFGSIVFQVDRDEQDQSNGRTEMQTVQSEIPESPQGRFHRLLRVGVVPFFQPIFDISGTAPKLTGYEILGRGRLPGLCTPEEMFNVATEMEKTAELSETLRKHGIEVADANFSSGKMIFVNTHSSEISSDRLAESLAKIRACFPDRRFILELPEAVLEMPESLSVIEAATKDMNIDTSIYGLRADTIRLSALERLAPKVVKFSETLIRDIGNATARKQKTISSMVKMLVELGVQPMAEFVETAEEHETIKELGFELAQGFHYAGPSSIEDCLDTGQDDASEDDASADNDRSATKELSKDAIFTDNSETKSSEVQSEIAVADLAAQDGALWILSQPEKNYTIQVMVTTSQKKAVAYVAKQNDAESFVIYPKKGSLRDLFVVAFGSFTDITSARSASERLKDATCFPLIRMLENVQAEARKAIS